MIGDKNMDESNLLALPQTSFSAILGIKKAAEELIPEQREKSFGNVSLRSRPSSHGNARSNRREGKYSVTEEILRKFGNAYYYAFGSHRP